MFTKILDLDNYDLENDTGENNIKVALNSGKTIDNAEMHLDLGFNGRKVNKFSHNALILPNGRVVIYFKKLRYILDKEALLNITKGILNKLPKGKGILIYDGDWERISYEVIDGDFIKEKNLIDYFGD